MCKRATSGMERCSNLNYLYLTMRKMNLYERRLFLDYFALLHGDPQSKPRRFCKIVYQYLFLLTEEELLSTLEGLFSHKEISTHTKKMIDALHETLILRANLRKKQHECQRKMKQIEIRKKILQIIMLAEHNILDRIPETLQRMKNKADKLELLPELFQILELQLELDPEAQSGAANDAIHLELKRINQHSAVIRKAHSMVLQCLVGKREGWRLPSGSPVAMHQLARQLEYVVKPLAPSHFYFYRKFVRGIIAMQEGNYRELERRMAELHTFMAGSHHLLPRLLSYLPQFLMLQAEVRSGNFGAGMERSEALLESLPENHLLADSVREFGFLAAFYGKQPDRAAKALVPVPGPGRETEASGDGQEIQVRIFYRACLLFQRKQFHRCGSVLEQCTGLRYEKSAWSLGYRLLRFMVAIELGQNEVADQEYLRFVRHFAGLKSSEKDSPRWQWILAAMKEMNAAEYRFTHSQNGKGRSRPLACLQAEPIPVFENWRTDGQELISFSAWLTTRSQPRPQVVY